MNNKLISMILMALLVIVGTQFSLQAVIYDEAALAAIKDSAAREGLSHIFSSLEPTGGAWEEIPSPLSDGPTRAPNAVKTRLLVNTSESGQVHLIALEYPKEGPVLVDGKVMVTRHDIVMTDQGGGQVAIKVSQREVTIGQAQLMRSGDDLVNHARILEYPVFEHCVDASCVRSMEGVTSPKASQSTSIAFLTDPESKVVSRTGEMEGALAKSEISALTRPWRNLLGSESAVRTSEGALSRNAEVMLKGRRIGSAEVMSLLRTTLHIFH